MDKVDQLEQSIMRIATEFIEVKSHLNKVQAQYKKLQSMMESLLNLMEEKSLINHDDLEDEMNSILNQREHPKDHLVEQELERIKKVHH